MPRTLNFSLDNTVFDASIIKVDRSHLYGTVSIETNDWTHSEQAAFFSLDSVIAVALAMTLRLYSVMKTTMSG